MRLIYEPKGAAREYASLACNPYKGCTHGCVYCYAPRILRMQKPDFHHKSTMRGDRADIILRQLEGDANYWIKKGVTGPVLLSFTTDIYCEDRLVLPTAVLIEKLNSIGLSVSVLTKAGKRSLDDLQILSRYPGNEYGVSLTFFDDARVRRYEPRAAPFTERAKGLMIAHDVYGIKTWASFEPLVESIETVEQMIHATKTYVDIYKFGLLNRCGKPDYCEWDGTAEDVKDMCDRLKARYFIKESLQKRRRG